LIFFLISRTFQQANGLKYEELFVSTPVVLQEEVLKKEEEKSGPESEEEETTEEETDSEEEEGARLKPVFVRYRYRFL
jgi:hypothetical protein